LLKAIAFDLDNTLYNQDDFELFALKEVAEKISRLYGKSSDEYFYQLRELYFSGVRSRTFDIMMQSVHGKLPDDWEEAMQKVILPTYRASTPNLKLFPEARILLDTLKKKECRIALITNGNELIQNKKIDLLGIRDYFDKIYISDSYSPPARKPDLRMFKDFLEDFSISGLEAAYFGDNEESDGSCVKLDIEFFHVREPGDLLKTVVLKSMN
jgi:putative hydrolase of the HAD superfamily